MAVTKRTRFEVLRRDKHTCQYCGAKAPDVALEMEHVVPVSLGGDDKPGNLVTACGPCNRGKASIAPDSPLVQGLSDRAAAYALGMQDKMTKFRADLERADEFIEQFDEVWKGWKITSTGQPVALPPDYELSLMRWCQMGIPFRAVELAIPKAMTKSGIRGEFGEFQYMAGIVWSMFEAREIDTTVTDETAAVLTAIEADQMRADSYETGWGHGVTRGATSERTIHLSRDLLAHHIDGTEMVTEQHPFDDYSYMTGGVRRVPRQGEHQDGHLE